MHEIPPAIERDLRAHGFSSGEIDELRRNGHIERADPAGRSIRVQLASAGFSHEGDTLRLDGMAISPDAIERLRRFNRFIPSEMLAQLEHATGQDIDGDGRIGGAEPTTAAGDHRHAQQQAGAQPAATSQGPFMGGRDASSSFRSTLLLVGGLAFGLWIALEAIRQ